MNGSHTPPRLAALLLSSALPARDRVPVLGDLQEEFAVRVSAQGVRRARRWYWRQAITSLWPSVGRRPRTGVAATPFDHDHGRTRMLTALGQDLRFALRMMRARPLVTGVATLSLGLGIALSAGVFGLLEAAVLRPLPVRNPDALRVVLEVRERGDNHNFSYPGFTAFRTAQRSFEDVVAYSTFRASLRAGGPPDMVIGELVSGSYFETLGPRIAQGRGITETDATPGAEAVAVLSAAEWRLRFGDAGLAGQSVDVNGRAVPVVGIAAEEFRGMLVGGDTRLWVPVTAQPIVVPGRGDFTAPTRSWLTVVGRLRDGVSEETASAELGTLADVLVLMRPPNATGPTRLRLAPGRQGDSMVPTMVASPLRLLLGASLLVLLVACANVAGLQTSRAQERAREIAVRRALGASRGRLARLLLVEALVVAGLGVAVGLAGAMAVGPLGVSLLRSLGRVTTLDVGANVTVLAFGAAAGLLAAIVAGLSPLQQTWRSSDTSAALEGGRSASGGPASQRTRRVLVTVQFALTLGLVATAGLLVRTVTHLLSIPTGLDVDRVILLTVDPQAGGHTGAAVHRYLERAMEQLAAVPGVEAVGYGSVAPIGIGGSRMGIEVPGYTPHADEDMEINFSTVSPGYFDALGITIREGRGISETDRREGDLVAVVNETMARRYWPDGSAVGRQFRFTDPPTTVVGIAEDVKYRTLREEPRPSFYLALAQGAARVGTLHVRTAGDAASMTETVRRALADVDRSVPVATVRTLADQVGQAVGQERVTMAIGLTLGTAATLLSGVGLFAAMTTTVNRRRRELGVRLAVGATPTQLSRLVVRDAVAMALAGSALGVALALWLGSLIESQLYGVSRFDPVSLVAAIAILSGLAIVASWAPARRASRVDPVEVLR